MDPTLAGVAQGGGLAEMLLPLVIIFGIIYLLVLRPKQRPAKDVTYGYPAWKRNTIYVLALVCVFISGHMMNGGLAEHLILVVVIGLIGHLLIALILEPRHIAREHARIRSEYTQEVAEALIKQHISVALAVLVEEEKIGLQVAMQAHHQGWTEFLIKAFIEKVWDLDTCTAIATGQPILGMESAAVLLMWGQPDTDKQEVLKTKRKDVWTWYSSRDNRKIVGRRATMEDGALVGWEIA